VLGTFIVTIALLAAMLYLIVRPFIWAPRPTSADVAHEAIPAPEYATVAAATTAAAAETTSVVTPADDTAVEETAEAVSDTTAVDTDASEIVTSVPAETAAPVATTTEPANPDDVRLRVEALIAARKAELSAAKCPGCQTVVASNDAFCRSCGTKLT
jgi:cytoskeletal protein RodZ